MTMPQVKFEFIYQPGDQWQLFSRSDRSTNAGRLLFGCLPPGVDLLKRLGQIEVFERVIELERETFARKSE